MLCHRCGVREATTRMTTIHMGSDQAPSELPLCSVCLDAIASSLRPQLNVPQLEEWAAWVEREGTEAEAVEMAAWCLEQAEHARQSLSPALLAFVERHSRPPA